MARTLQESAITTRSARSRLDQGTYWRGIDPDTHLGYRRNARGGKWLVRWRENGAYRQETIGTADDEIAADGILTFEFAQAVRKAKQQVRSHRETQKAAGAGPLETVATAVAAYSTMRAKRAEGRVGARGLDAESRLRKHVLSACVADRPLHTLSEADLQKWRSDLSAALAPTTVRRLINDLRAALNAAARNHRAKLPPTLPVVIKNGLSGLEIRSCVAREMQVLADFEVRDVIKACWEIDAAGAWEGDFGRLVVLMAATGARFGQVATMRVGDVQTAHGRVMIPTSFKGRGPKAKDRIAVRVGEDVLKALRPAVSGRKASDTLFERWRHRQVGPAKWERVDRGAWKASTEMSRPWRLAIAKASLASDIVPYALRHSSIVRGLRSNLPVRLVAALHDTSTAMVEKHYAAYIIDALDALSAAAIIPLTETDASN